ncbi:MAG: hypothetical protein II746_02540, partial [Bacteroidaceae bacterium]|nr:hypothetical protein [Bacteroidaceae bacterium]
MTKRFLLAAAFVMSAAAALAEGDVTKEKFTPFFTREEAPHLEHVLPEPPSLTDPLFHNDWVQYQWGRSVQDSERGRLAV